MKTSVIVVNRNDGYKEDERFIIHLKTLLDTFDEVNYVDWNSPEESFLTKIKDKIPQTGRIKHFVIPPEIHNTFSSFIPELPNCYDSLALNIPLRRTDADWIVCSHTDIIPPFKEDFLSFLNKCDKDTLYSVSRRDIEYKEVIQNKHKLEDYHKYLDQTSKPRYAYAKVTPNDNYSLINCCGDFQIAHRDLFHKVKGFEEGMPYKCFVDTNIQKKAVLNGFKIKAEFDLPVYHMSHTNMLPQAHTEEIHKISKEKIPKYNDSWDWVEYFDQSQNDNDWGLGSTEIEFELI
jgi:hypothetical protein